MPTLSVLHVFPTLFLEIQSKACKLHMAMQHMVVVQLYKRGGKFCTSRCSGVIFENPSDTFFDCNIGVWHRYSSESGQHVLHSLSCTMCSASNGASSTRQQLLIRSV